MPIIGVHHLPGDHMLDLDAIDVGEAEEITYGVIVHMDFFGKVSAIVSAVLYNVEPNKYIVKQDNDEIVVLDLGFINDEDSPFNNFEEACEWVLEHVSLRPPPKFPDARPVPDLVSAPGPLTKCDKQNIIPLVEGVF